MTDPLETIAEEVAMIRKLLVFALLNSGVSQEKVAGALGVSQATISRLSGAAVKRNVGAQKVKKRQR